MPAFSSGPALASRRLVGKTLFASLIAAGMVVASLGAGSVQAQTYPSKPIRLIAPFLPGGTVDNVSRAVSVHLAENLGQQVIVENRSGASGNIGAAYVASAPPDGHTLLLTASTVIANPLVMKEKPAYGSHRNFTPLGQVASTPLVFVVSPNSGINTVKDFIQHAKAHPKEVNFGVGGFGSGGHLAMESFNVETGTAIPMIIYKGSAQTLTDIAGGQVTAMLEPIGTSLPFITSGRLKAIAVTGETRNALLPDVPTLSEAGVDNIDFVSWYGLWAPPGLPADIAERIQQALTASLNQPEMQKWLAQQGLNAGKTTGKAFEKLANDEYDRAERVVKAAGINKH
ncbi:MAG: tripartite tricarboxylate transporter substrate binding protein [Pigmentiphaga sp.]|nr:tripartite tricarboxylate transporter substrate binding protein [Pigmentiphaga sp.]